MIRCHPDQSDRRGGSKPRTMGTRRRKVDASARQPTAPGKQAFFLFFLVPRRSLTTHISNSTRQPSQAAGALFEKLADAARGHRPVRAPRPTPMQPIVLGKRSRAPEARKAPAPAAGDRRRAARPTTGTTARRATGRAAASTGRTEASAGRAGARSCAQGCSGTSARSATAPASTGGRVAGARRAGARARGGEEGARTPPPGPSAAAARAARPTAGTCATTARGKGICEHGRQRSCCCCAAARATASREAATQVQGGAQRGLEHLRAREGAKEVLTRAGPLRSASTGGCEASRRGVQRRVRLRAREAAKQVAAYARASQICEHGRRDTCKACKGSRTGPGEAAALAGVVEGCIVAKDSNRCSHGYTRDPRVRAQRVSEVFFERLKAQGARSPSSSRLWRL